MLGYALRRLLLALPLLLGITFVSFTVIPLEPGEPAEIQTGDLSIQSDAQARQLLREMYDLQTAPRPVREVARTPRPARFRQIVLARRPARTPEDRRAAAGNAAPQHHRDAHHRRARGADRRPVRHAPVLALRQGDDGLCLPGLRDAGLLAGPAPHDPLRRAARLAADLGAPLAQLGVPLVLAP